MYKTAYVGVNCASSSCQDEHPPATWVALVDGDQEPQVWGVIMLCGPCAAAYVTLDGYTVKSRPAAYVASADRLVWYQHDGEDPDLSPTR